MTTRTGKARCIICEKEKSAVRCEGCLQIFCYNHLNDHYQQLNQQLDEIQINRDLFRQKLNEQINHLQEDFSIKQIDKWESDSIEKIQQTAKQCRERIFQHTNEHCTEIDMNLTKLTDQIREMHKENDFNEIDLNQLKQKLIKLEKELDEIPKISIQQDSASFINRISIVVSSGKHVFVIFELNN